MDALPIDAAMPDIVRVVARERAVVVDAPPGAGKTTRVPRALFDAGLLGPREVLVLEPRRLAARLAARWVAEELGQPLGGAAGYQVRFEEVSSAATRIRFVTEGILTRRLLTDPTLANVAAVIVDEFHERHLAADLGLALLTRLKRTARPDLALVVMSATLETGQVARYLGAPVVCADGRRFEVAVDHAPAEDARRVEDRVAGALKRLVQGGLDGDVLVFLPGAREIRRAREACGEVAQRADLELLPLHGELPPEEQDRAIRKSPCRKVILSTNVAETSITIDGVVAVIDSGLARLAGHSPWSGLSTLTVAKISQASATQRAGRAGRTRAGRAIRLFTKADFDSRRAHDVPEIRRLDLAQPLLELAAMGIAVDDLPWLEPPPAANVEAAWELLTRLGALDAAGITTAGRRMAALPLHPRLARLVLEADARGAGREACVLAAILGEREVRVRSPAPSAPAETSHDSDPVAALETFLEARAADFANARSSSLDRGALLAVERAARQIERSFGSFRRSAAWRDVERALRMALLAAFPDRVARRRSPGGRELVFSGSGSGQLSPGSAVHHADLLVAVDAEERREGAHGGVVVRSASAIEEDWLLDVTPAGLSESVSVAWNAERERAESRSRLVYGALVLDERPTGFADPTVLSRTLFEAASSAGLRAFTDPASLERLIERVRFAAGTFPEAGFVEPPADAQARTLARACEGKMSFAELRATSFVALLAAELGVDGKLDRYAPQAVVLPCSRRVQVHYDPGQPPWIESRLQDFFGAREAPKLGGRVPLVIHLLAPNGRAQQVTTDLAGFWERHYPGVRKELMRRYPRHAWPEDPLAARPPAPRR